MLIQIGDNYVDPRRVIAVWEEVAANVVHFSVDHGGHTMTLSVSMDDYSPESVSELVNNGIRSNGEV